MTASSGGSGTAGERTASRSVWRRIGRSWLALKTWVKVWLFFLNLVLLGSVFFLDDPAGRWTLIAYFAAGPLLLAIMRFQRGLTRLLGLAHLIPWTPLQVYLLLRVMSDVAGPRLTADRDPALFGYVILVLGTVGACLALDVYDLVRWLRGERFVMGSEEAHRAGASRRVELDPRG